MPSSPRARAVAELPLDVLLVHPDELARRWALALVASRPLEELGEVPLAQLARDAPALCAQMLRAVQSDVELERLTGRGAHSAREGSALAPRVGQVCGADTSAQLASAVERLRGALWEALLAVLPEPSARLLGDVGDRLAFVCSAALEVALGALPATRVAEELGAPEKWPRAPRAGGATPAVAAASAAYGATRAVIVDEHLAGAAPTAAATFAEPLLAGPTAAASEIAIHDQRREEGPVAWIGSIGAQLDRYERDGVPFAVLLVEIADLDRLRREGRHEELVRASEHVDQALRVAVDAASASLTRERPGRCWVLAPGADRAEAERLAQRLLASVGGAGAPVLAIGSAVCPEDGRQASALAAHADLGLYAARAAARSGRSAGERSA